MDGVLIDLLKTKWNVFVKRRFYRQFFLFAFYFLISLVCFTLRPGPPDKSSSSPSLNTTQNTTNVTTNVTKIPIDGNLFNNTILNITIDIPEKDMSMSSNNSYKLKNETKKFEKNQKIKLDGKKANCTEIINSNSSLSNQTTPCQKIRSNSGGAKDYTPKGMN